MRRSLHITAIAALLANTSAQALADGPRWTNELRPSTVMFGAPDEAYSLTKRMARYRVPAVSIATIERCQIVETYATGDRILGGAAVDATSEFQAGSISKAVTAAAALRLSEQGKLSLDEDLGKSIPGWTAKGEGAGSALTARQLLSHTGGVGVHGFEGYSANKPLPSLLQILEGTGPANSKPITIEATPGKEFRYSGGGYTLIQALLADRAGKTFPSVVNDLVFHDTRMENSAFGRPIKAASAALGHDRQGRPIEGGWHAYPELAAAGLWSTPTDLARFAIAVMQSNLGQKGTTLLHRSTAKQMMAPQSPGPWGLGFELRRKDAQTVFMHTGETAGYLSILLGFPSTCSGVVVMMNGEGGAGLLKEVVQAISRDKGWPQVFETIQLRPLTAAQEANLAGHYVVGAPALEFDISADSQNRMMLALANGQKGRVVSDIAGRVLVVDAELNPLAALKANSDGTLSVLMGGRTFIAEKGN